MTKRQLTAEESFDIRQALHVATLDALMASRRWAPGDLVFQGGTSLHLAHGSPRFSEDLDFVVDASLRLDRIGDGVRQRLQDVAWLPEGATLTVTRAKTENNPLTFVVAVGGQNLLGGVRVKVELWQASPNAVKGMRASVLPVQLARGRLGGFQTFVPTAEMHEIYADKVFALPARPYLKPRDIFDLHWIKSQHSEMKVTPEELAVRLETYPGESASDWLQKARDRLQSLETSREQVHADLKRWLPSSWPLTQEQVAAMLETAREAVEHGMAQIEAAEEILKSSRPAAQPPRP